MTELTHTATKVGQVPDKPEQPKVEWKDSSIMVNSTNHSLPTTKKYFLKECVDVLQGEGTLLAGPYYIRLSSITSQYNIYHIQYLRAYKRPTVQSLTD